MFLDRLDGCLDNALFRSMLHFSDERLMIFDGGGVCVGIDISAAMLLGYDSRHVERLLGARFQELFRREPRVFFPRIREAGEQKFTLRDQIVAFDFSGQTMSLEVKCTLLCDDDHEFFLFALAPSATESGPTQIEIDQYVRKLTEQAEGAKVANGLIHNLGNLFNSINISTQHLTETLKDSKIPELLKANRLFLKNLHRIGEYVTEDPAGRFLPEFYRSVGEFLKEDLEKMQSELADVQEKVGFIKEMIGTQQDYAKSEVKTRKLALNEIVDKALQIELPSMLKRGIRIEKNYQDQFYVFGVKSKVLHVFLNLFKNAKEAMAGEDREDAFVKIHIQPLESDRVEVIVADNGVGIPKTAMEKMFTYGFTTKAHGHGFGLYSSAEAMNELGGSIEVTSDGLGKGASFRLVFPRFRDTSTFGT
ncbi:Histidine kinase domain-containing protein [Sulfidibacter corallicola]|uniref:histidine kinase n=1 Tax=Sulfidibacter corallicola TaxID=2818388 RepID=A0A8A4TPW2_SULCO|nr:ATP-binding protein [Sulfidibacter corallicola]QTD52016.1 hypothetical protein J3U87_06045 [Sulfidibacter corallicola]